MDFFFPILHKKPSLIKDCSMYLDNRPKSYEILQVISSSKGNNVGLGLRQPLGQILDPLVCMFLTVPKAFGASLHIEIQLESKISK